MAGKHIADIFTSASQPLGDRIENFPIYIRRKTATRFLTLYEIFKQVLTTKGSIIECGVHHGFGLMSWAHFSAVLEPANLTRRIYGFDSFEGFTATDAKDRNRFKNPAIGGLRAESFNSLRRLIGVYDSDRFLGHIPKVSLIKGDARASIPEFIKRNPHIVISLLFMDFDLFEPTKVALEHFLPRMPKGSILAFDELDNPIWPGETLAALETLGLKNLELKRLPWDPYISFAAIQ